VKWIRSNEAILLMLENGAPIDRGKPNVWSPFYSQAQICAIQYSSKIHTSLLVSPFAGRMQSSGASSSRGQTKDMLAEQRRIKRAVVTHERTEAISQRASRSQS